jgi:Flp pilus assembly pilin Flp
MRPISRWLRREDGQDLAEYCLLTALVALVAAAIFLHVTGGIKNLWNFADQTTSSAATAASPAGSSSGGGDMTKGGK